MRVAHVADLHISGKNYDRCKKALDQVVEYVCDHKNDIDTVVFSGDVFELGNVADRFKSVGDLQKLFLDAVRRMCAEIFILEGNHDQSAGLSALEFLRGRIEYRCYPYSTDVFKIHVVSTIKTRDFSPYIEKSMCQFIFIPWIPIKGRNTITLVREKLKGLKIAKECPTLLFGHLNIVGNKIGRVTEDSPHSFTMEELESIGADYMSFGHIHKRGNGYCGALFQQNFGEEGNPQGFEVIDTETMEVEYVEIDLPEHKTFQNIAEANAYTKPVLRRIRVTEGEKVESLSENFETDRIEREYAKKDYTKRSTINEDDSEIERAIKYMAIHPLPEGVTEEMVLKELEEVNG